MNELNRKIIEYVIPTESHMDHLLFEKSSINNLVELLTLQIKRQLES